MKLLASDTSPAMTIPLSVVFDRPSIYFMILNFSAAPSTKSTPGISDISLGFS